MRILAKLIVLLLFLPAIIRAQESEIDRLIKSELKMTFPSIYFKHKSTDYASMPYSADSCFKFIADHFKDNLNSYVIWRDTLETEALTNRRMEILKEGLRKYIKHEKMEIHSMENEQKVSRHTIAMTSDSAKINYLLTLNSVFDISKTRFPTEDKSVKGGHVEHPRIWCLSCWRHHRFTKEYRKMNVARKQTKKQ